MLRTLTLPFQAHMLRTQVLAQAILFTMAGCLIGRFTWGGDGELMPLVLILALPLAWGLAQWRSSVFGLMAGYYLVGARGLPGGAVVFFGDASPAWMGWAMWIFSNLVLAIPFLLLWGKTGRGRPWRFVAATCCSAIPPLAFIGWLSPLAVAGLIFPSLGWIGLLLALLLMGALVLRNGRWIVVLAGIACVANGFVLYGAGKEPANWSGLDTKFARLSSAGTDNAAQLTSTLSRVQWVADFANNVPPNSVTVLPETVLGSFDAVADFMLQDVESALTNRGARVLVGVEIPLASGQYKNAVMVLGARRDEDRTAVQNIPVPFGMWKPWATDGALAKPFGRENLISVNGVRTGVVVCYEQVLSFSLLWMMMGQPDLIAAVSNVWWARDTSIPAIQLQTVEAFARLFGVPVVVAKNI